MGALDSTLLYTLGGLCLVLVSVAAVRRWRERGVTVREATRAQSARLRDQERLAASLQELLEQIEHVAQRVDARVETQLKRLEELVREADARIARWQSLHAPDRPPARPAEPPPARSKLPPAPPAVPETPAAPPAAVPPAAAERRRRVYELADAGATPLTIADTLHMPLGEVELLLNLRSFA